MKRITFASGTIVTGDAVAAALLDFASQLSTETSSSAVEIPVLESDGTVGIHTIVLNATIQFDVADEEADGASTPDAELERFPVPDLAVQDDTMVAVMPSDDDDREAENFNRAIADIDNALDHPES